MLQRFSIGLAALLLVSTGALAIEQSWLFGPQGGPVWFFLFDTDCDKVDMPVALAYGVHATRVFDFQWVHDFGFQIDFLRASGEGWKVNPRDDPFDRKRVRFAYSYYFASLSATYFMGGRFFDPFFSGGFGATVLRVDQTRRLPTDEVDFTVNLSGGVDFRIAKWLSIGIQQRYLY
ncbi:MAG TPA: hypothetical protein ENF73_01090, partial [Proteobacteria bacterium]|nr:hypothetical protein [Pseudomonadota bacterium]